MSGPEAPVSGRETRPRALLLVAALGAIVALVPMPALEPRAHATLVVLTVAAGGWISEAVPVAWTALVIPLLGVALGIATPKAAFAAFGDPILFLFFGTFLLTTAVFDHGLQERLTRSVLGARRVQQHPERLLWAVAILGCTISAWVNNTATTVLLLPLALTAEGRVSRSMLVAVLLSAAYAPSIGGIATPVGTAPNLIGLRLLESGTGTDITFAHWCAVFAPLALVTTLLTTAVLHVWGWRRRAPDTAATRSPIAAVLAPRAPWSRAEKTLLPICAAVVLLWITPGILQATALGDRAWLSLWSGRLPETCVPLLGGLVLFLLPARAGRGAPRILDASVLARLDWSTLLLFGGGLSLGGMMFETGLARVLGEALFAHLPIQGEFGIVLASTLLAVAVSEVTSNTASASLVVPIVLALAQAAGVDPIRPAMAATVGCSFGFMLPVSTPPNALVYATGRVRIREMVRYGVWLDVAGIFLISLWVTWLG